MRIFKHPPVLAGKSVGIVAQFMADRIAHDVNRYQLSGEQRSYCNDALLGDFLSEIRNSKFEIRNSTFDPFGPFDTFVPYQPDRPKSILCFPAELDLDGIGNLNVGKIICNKKIQLLAKPDITAHQLNYLLAEVPLSKSFRIHTLLEPHLFFRIRQSQSF